MGEVTKIQWCHHTHNPWWGCVKIAPECAACYAEAWAKRTGHGDTWGPWGRRRFFGEAHWREPLKWQRDAVAVHERRRVFCASMADAFELLPEEHPDVEAMHEARLRLWALIEATPALDWLLLTKRPENVRPVLPRAWLDAPRANVWIGTSVGHDDQIHRVRQLVDVPAVVRFVSAEPLIGSLDLSQWMPTRIDRVAISEAGSLTRLIGPAFVRLGDRIDWVIVGGESGPKARGMCMSWLRNVVFDCAEAAVPLFVKQLGARPYETTEDIDAELTWPVGQWLKLKDQKGGDPNEWPPDLRIRNFPIPRGATP